MAGVYVKSKPFNSGSFMTKFVTCTNILDGAGDALAFPEAVQILNVSNIALVGAPVTITWSGTTLTLVSTAGTEDGTIRVDYI